MCNPQVILYDERATSTMVGQREAGATCALHVLARHEKPNETCNTRLDAALLYSDGTEVHRISIMI